MSKEEILKETVKCFERLIDNIGEQTTEYHWREFAGIVSMLNKVFPEYNLRDFQNNIDFERDEDSILDNNW